MRRAGCGALEGTTSFARGLQAWPPEAGADSLISTTVSAARFDVIPLKECARIQDGHSPRGSSQDRFSKYTAEQIVEKARTWLQAVEQASPGRMPIIYTNKTFWHERGLDKASGLEGYSIWIADYAERSRLAQTPIVPPGFEVALWQFSDRGHFTQSGIAATHVDVSVYKGARPDFTKRFGLPE